LRWLSGSSRQEQLKCLLCRLFIAPGLRPRYLHVRPVPSTRASLQSMTATEFAVKAENIHKSFGAIEVLRGISFTALQGQVLSIIGASGSGKSTLLRCVNHLVVP